MENNATYTSTGLKYGLYVGAALIILSLVFYLAGMIDTETGKPNQITTFISYAVSIGGIVMAILYYKNNNDGYLSVGNAIGVGLMTGLISGLLVAVWNFIFFNFIDPNLLQVIKDNAMEEALARPGVDENAEAVIEKWVNAFTSPAVISLFSVLGQLVVGLVVGLIGGLVLKNKRPAIEV